MALAFVGGAALGAAFGELLKAVLKRKNKVAGFKPTFERLEFTIKSITPIIKQIEDLKKELDHPKEELDELTKQLKKGEEIVLKCSTVSWWNPYTRADYTMKLHKLDNSITRFLTIIMQAQQARDTLQILLEVKDVGAKLERINVREPKGELNNPIGLVGFCGVPDPPDFMVGLDVPLKELKMRLLKDGEPPMLVLSAPGGCGKTTLVEKLCQDEEIKGKFKDNIFFVTVSNTPSLKVIIQKLFQHKCNQAPEFQNDEDAVNQLEQLLKRIGPDPVLLVLDDVWSGSESLLEKFVFQIPDYKILVTSRSVFPRFDSTYKLKLLNDEDSMSLFRHSAFPQNEISYMPDKDLLNEIVRNCKGFPLALIVVGRSLRGQPGAVWRNRLMEWSGGQSIFNSQSDILNCLKTSLDVLEVIVKECFMDLGSFPEDQRIPAAALIDMWVELYKLDEDGVYAKLHELSTRNLVNLVTTRKDAIEMDGCYNEHFVMQHDLLRELALYQSSQYPVELRNRLTIDISGNNLHKCSELQQQPTCVRLLSISTDEMFSSSWSDMQLPEFWSNMPISEVEVLVLNFRTKNYTLPEFIEKMDRLKVLIVMNHGFYRTELSNFPLLGSLSNLKRIRLDHISIPFFSNIQLKNLQKISLKMCKIGQAFGNCTIQHPDMMPNLVEMDIDYCNDLVELPESLCDSVKLRKLGITNCHKLSKLPDRIDNLTNLEVLRLHACTDLLELPSSIGSLHKLRFLDISECLNLREMPKEMGQLFNLRKLHMRGCSGLSELPQSIMDLEHLKDVFCDEETSCLWEEFSLPNLKITVTKENINLNWLPNL